MHYKGARGTNPEVAAISSSCLCPTRLQAGKFSPILGLHPSMSARADPADRSRVHSPSTRAQKRDSQSQPSSVRISAHSCLRVAPRLLALVKAAIFFCRSNMATSGRVSSINIIRNPGPAASRPTSTHLIAQSARFTLCFFPGQRSTPCLPCRHCHPQCTRCVHSTRSHFLEAASHENEQTNTKTKTTASDRMTS